MRPLARNCGASSCPIASYPRASARMAGNWESSRRTNACTPSRCHEASPKHFPSKDDPEMGGIAGTPFCRLEDGDCISKPTQFQINHSKPNEPIPTRLPTGWTGAAGGGPAGPGFGAEPHLKEIFHFLIDPSAAHEAQAALGDSFPNFPRRRHRRLHFALPQPSSMVWTFETAWSGSTR